MTILPPALNQYWLSHSLAKSDPAFFKVTSEGDLIEWGGVIHRYSNQPLTPNTFIGDIFPFLAHNFPLMDLTESMQWIETEEGITIDVHFIFEASEGWVLFLESGEEAQKVQSLMQQGNELKLLRQKYDKVVQRQLEREQSSLVLESLLEHQPNESPSSVSILQIRLHLNASIQDKQKSLEFLNEQLREVFKVAIEEGGLIHHVFGQTVAILFGLLPAPLSSAEQAINTAKKIIHEHQQKHSEESSLEEPHMGMGITTGHLDIDVRPVKNRKIFHIIGQTILRAEEMLLLIQPGLLLIDQNTFKSSNNTHSDFKSWSIPSKKIPCHTPFYAQPLNE